LPVNSILTALYPLYSPTARPHFTESAQVFKRERSEGRAEVKYFSSLVDRRFKNKQFFEKNTPARILR
jgi:hypothetical protein